MGLLMKKFVHNDCLLGIWEINEDFFTLYEKLDLSEEEVGTLNGFKSYNRKLEWLSVRVLLTYMTEPGVRIYYNGNRKPFLTDKRFNISISHSKRLTAIIISKNHRVGIDLEYTSGKIAKLAGKFLTKPEEDAIIEKSRNYQVYIYWCAKETLYKICDKQNIDFREDIIIEPFIPAKQGTLSGKVFKNPTGEDFTLHYFKYNNYTVVWCCK